MGNLQFKTFPAITKNELIDDDQWTVANFQNFLKNNDLITSVIVLSSFAVTKGVYFYEIELLQGIEIQVGWTTKLVEISKNNQYFVKNTQLAILKTQNSSTNDIFGCFVNIEQKIINFYYNGQLKKVEYDTNIFNYKPIFAIALVSYKHAIQVNFGQTKFKYPPNETYNTFHSVSIKNFPKNSLTQIQTKNNIELFCEKNLKNRFKLLVFEYENYQNDQNNLFISLFHYCDSEQILFNQTIIKIETMINEGYQYEVIKNFILAFLNSNFKNNFYRFLQSIIEVIGYKIESNKISKLDYCIILIYTEYFEQLKKLKVFLFEDALTFHTFFVSYFFNFLKSNTDFVKNQIKTHYICLILIYNLNNENFCCKYLKEQCKSFLLHVLLHSKDPWSQLYSFIALKQSETNFKQFLLDLITKQENPPFMIYKNKFNYKNELGNISIKRNLAQLQLNLYLNYCLLQNKIDDQHNFFKYDTEIEYYFNNTNNTIMLSSSNLMVRNDSFEYKTIRYKFSINPPSFYFEVTILTVGKMSIGLAAKQMDIENVVGKNSFSIGIDGYNRCLWMHEKAYKFKTFQPEWNAGDVIGIYVDFVNRLVIFGINNKIIEINGDPFEEEFIFSILPCHVAASFDQYQQCYFNFNCTIVPKAFLNKLKTINQHIQDVNNSVLMCGSTVTRGKIAINDDKQLNFIMKNDKATERSLQTWSSVTGEINLAYGKVLSENYKKDNRITLNACEQWRNKMESILTDIRNPVQYYDEYMRKIGEIYRKLENDAQKSNSQPSSHNQPSFECEVIPQAFLNKLESINRTITNVHNSVLMCDSTATTKNIDKNVISNQFNNLQTLNYDKQLNFIMKSDEASKKSLQTWCTVTEKVNLAYGRVLSEGYKEDNQITLNSCKQWRNQLESILKDIRNPVHSYDEYMRKIGKICQKLKNDAQKPNFEPGPNNQPLMLIPALVQLEQNNFSLWLNSLMMVLSSAGAVQAVESELPEEHSLNLIARGFVLQAVPAELQAPIKKLKIAYKMLKVLRNIYEKKNKLSQPSTVNVSKKRTFPYLEKSDFKEGRKRQNQSSTS